MKITLKSIGTAKAEPNYVNARISATINDVDKDRCGKCLIDLIGNLDTKLKEMVKIVYFNNYSIRTINKTVEVENKKTGEKEHKAVFDYYLGSSSFSIEFKLDFKLIEKVTELCKKLSKDFTTKQTNVVVSPQFTYTLTKESYAELNSYAVNDALDKMKLQAHSIADHLGLKSIELMEVNFVENSLDNKNIYYDTAAMRKSSNIGDYKEYTIASLDEMLKFKDIEVSTEIYSYWQLN